MAARIKLNSAGVRELLKSAAVQKDLETRGRRIAAAAGPGHEVETFVGSTRARVTVRTTTTDAALSEQNNQTLTNAVKAGG